MNEFKYLKDAQCVRFNDCGRITWHVFENEEDALRWKLNLVEWTANLWGVDPMTFFNARGVALIRANSTEVLVKLRRAKTLSRVWSECKDLEDAETRVLRRIVELQFD